MQRSMGQIRVDHRFWVVVLLTIVSTLALCPLEISAAELKFPGLKTLSSREKKAEVFRLILQATENFDNALAIENFLAKELSADDAQLFILPLTPRDPKFTFAYKVLIQVLLGQARLGGLTDVLSREQNQQHKLVFPILLEELKDHKIIYQKLKSSNIVEKKRFILRLLDFATEENMVALAEIIASFDHRGDLEGELRRFARTKSGTMAAARSVVLIRMSHSQDIKREIVDLRRDENPYIRNLAENYYTSTY